MTDRNPDFEFNVGDEVFMTSGSDRNPGNVVEVSKSGKTVKVQSANWKVVSGGEHDGSAKYEYWPNPEGGVTTYRRNNKGDFRQLRCKYSYLGHGYSRYYDPHF